MSHTTRKVIPLLSAQACDALYLTGIKVHVEHHRCRKDFSPRQFFKLGDIRRQTMDILQEAGDAAHLVETPMQKLDPKGGKTIVHLLDLERGLQWTAEARCHPDDHYNRTEGINRAFGTAILRMKHDSTIPVEQTPIYAKPIDKTLLSPKEQEQLAAISDKVTV